MYRPTTPFFLLLIVIAILLSALNLACLGNIWVTYGRLNPEFTDLLHAAKIPSDSSNWQLKEWFLDRRRERMSWVPLSTMLLGFLMLARPYKDRFLAMCLLNFLLLRWLRNFLKLQSDYDLTNATDNSSALNLLTLLFAFLFCLTIAFILRFESSSKN